MAGSPAEDSSDARLLTRAFVLLGLADLAYFTSIGVTIHGLPLYVTGPVGSDEAGAGLAFGAFGLTALLCRPFAGRFSDTRGRRPVMVVGATTCALGMVLLPLAGSLAAVIGIRLLQGVAEAAFFVASFALLADLAPPARLGEALSYNSMGLYLGTAFGPPLGEALIAWSGYDAAWYGAAGLAALAAALTFGVAEPVRERSTGGRGRLVHRPAVPVSVGFFASLMAIGGFLAFASLHAEEVGMGNTSLALLTYGLVVVLCRVVFAKVPDRLPSLVLGSAALTAIAGGLAVMALWRAPAGLLGGTVLVAVGVAFSTPAFFSAVFATAEPSQRGAASGTAGVFIDLGLGFGPILLGAVADSLGIPWAFGAGAGVALLGAAWTLVLARSAAQAGRSSASRMR